MKDVLGVQGQQRRPVWIEQREERKERGGMRKWKVGGVADEVRDRLLEGGGL